MDEVAAAFDEAIQTTVSPAKQWIKQSFGYLLGAAGLIWVLHDFHLGHLRGLIANIDWRWIAIAVVCDVVSYICQGVRWRLLLKPLCEISSLRATQAIYAGLFTNELLPLRLGEIVRAYLVSRWTRVNVLAIIPSMIVERLLDGLWLAAGIGLTMAFMPLPGELIRAADVLGAGLVLAVAVLVFMVLRPRKKIEVLTRTVRFISPALEKLSGGMRGMGRTREFYLSLFGSLLLLVFQALAFWLVMQGCGLHLNLWIGIAVFLIVHLGTAIPNAPANVGSYQFFTVIGLTLFGVDKVAATGFSIVVFVMLTLPLLILGFFAVSFSGTSLMKIRHDVRNIAAIER